MLVKIFVTTKRLIIAVLFAVMLSNLTLLRAQNISIDSTVDYSFNLLKLSELIKLKKSFTDSDTSSLTEFLLRKRFIKENTTYLFFSNDSLNQSLEFHDTIPAQITFKKANLFVNTPVLILKSTNTAWKNVLTEFVRQQKWNEEIILLRITIMNLRSSSHHYPKN